MNGELVDKLMRYEDGGMDEPEVLLLFEHLVKTGLAWKLQGHYGRMARRLLDAGLIGAAAGVEA